MQTDRTLPRCGGVTSSITSPTQGCVLHGTSYWLLLAKELVFTWSWLVCTRGRNGCLLVVSVTHTTPPGGRLCLVVMIHHSWLSGTLQSEDHDIIPISSCEELDKRGAHPNKPLRFWLGLVRCGTGVDKGVAKPLGGKALRVSWDIHQRVNRWGQN